jgi:hypothetical protein
MISDTNSTAANVPLFGVEMHLIIKFSTAYGILVAALSVEDRGAAAGLEVRASSTLEKRLGCRSVLT